LFNGASGSKLLRKCLGPSAPTMLLLVALFNGASGSKLLRKCLGPSAPTMLLLVALFNGASGSKLLRNFGEVPKRSNGSGCDERSVPEKSGMEKRVNSGEPLTENMLRGILSQA